MADWRLGLHAEMSLLLDMSFHTRSSFLCATETESMATVCLSPHSPASGGRLHAFDRRCAQHQHELMKNVWFGALCRCICQGRVGLCMSGGEGGEGC